MRLTKVSTDWENWEDELPEKQNYARAQHQANRAHYLITAEGHVLADLPPNRKVAKTCGGILWTTRQALNTTTF